MDGPDYWTRRRLSRRRLLAGTGYAVVGLVGTTLAGCSSNNAGKPASPASQASTRPSSAQTSAPAAKQTAAAAPAIGKRGGDLHVGITYQPSSLDAQLAANGGDSFFIDAIYNGLLAYDQAGNLEQDRALSSAYELVDDTTVTFHLRQNVKFSDSTDFNASAVKYNIARGQDPSLAAVVFSNLKPITSVETPDTATATLKLSAPSPGLLVDLGGRPGYMLSPTAVDKLGKQFGSNPVGTGPFVLADYAAGSQVTLKKNPGYWRKAPDGSPFPYLDTVIVRTVLDATARYAGITTGDLQLTSIDTPDVPKVKSSTSLSLIQADGGTVNSSMLVFNVAVPPCDNVNVRRAVAWALDPNAVNKAVYGGLSRVADAFLYTPGSWSYQPIPSRPHYDAAKAKSFLSQAGVSGTLALNMLCHSAPAVVQQTQIYQEELRQIGISVNLTTEAVSQATQHFFQTGGVPVYSTTWGTSTSPDSATLVTLDKDGFYNPAKKQDPDLQALLEKARTMYDENQRKTLYEQIAEMALDRAQFVPMLYGTTFGGVTKNVKGTERIWTAGATWRYEELSLS